MWLIRAEQRQPRLRGYLGHSTTGLARAAISSTGLSAITKQAPGPRLLLLAIRAAYGLAPGGEASCYPVIPWKAVMPITKKRFSLPERARACVMPCFFAK